MVGTVPLIEIVGHLDLTAIEPKSSELFDTVFVYKEFYPDLHGVLYIAFAWSVPQPVG